MDSTTIIIFGGMIFSGFIIGYPLGHLFGRREVLSKIDIGSDEIHLTFEPGVMVNCRNRLDAKDILNAEVIE